MRFTGFSAAFLAAGVVLAVLISSDSEMQEFWAYFMVVVLIASGLTIAWLEGRKPPSKPTPRGKLLLAPLLMQDSLPDGPTPMMETPLATIVLSVLLGLTVIAGAYFAVRYLINRTNERDLHS